MSGEIIEKYKELHEACKKYPKINLSSRCGEKPKLHKEQNNYAKDGFIEVFCIEKGNERYDNKKSWEEFRDSGMLWWINMILHTFGWAITVEIEDNKVIDAYPARVKFRGFGEKNNTEGYIKVSQYMKENVSELLEEAEN